MMSLSLLANRRSSGSAVRRVAPRIDPVRLPIPPSTTMMMTSIDFMNVKLFVWR